MSQNQNNNSNKSNETIGAIVIVVLMVLFGLLGFASCNGDSSPRGDGKSKCKNCGRSSVVALGYCSSCYDGFMSWLDRTGGK